MKSSSTARDSFDAGKPEVATSTYNYSSISNTPYYEERWVGLPSRAAVGGGVNVYAAYGGVTNHKANANAIPTSGEDMCVPVIEGCMEEDARARTSSDGFG